MDYSAGIDLGGTSTKLALVSSDGSVPARSRMAALPGERPADLFLRAGAGLKDLAGSANLPWPPPGGIGIGFPAILNSRTGWLTFSGALGWANCDVRGPAEAGLGCRVAVDCDSNAGALADLYWGPARSATNVLYISWGTGIGAGLVLGRRLYRSTSACMGEFGHTPVEPDGSRLCYCGCRGCLEIEVGGRALGRQATNLMGRAATAEEAASSPLCRTVMERAVRLMARALAGALVLLNPDCVVFGGGVSQVLTVDQFSSVFNRELVRLAPAFARESLRIVISAFRDSAGAVGAAMLPRHQFEEGVSTDAVQPKHG